MAKKQEQELQKQLQEVKKSLMLLEGQYKASIKEKLSDADQRARDYVADQPYKSVGIAFGAGALIGALIAHLAKK